MFLKTAKIRVGLLIAILNRSSSFTPFYKKQQLRSYSTTKTKLMGWSDTWSDILSGGNPRWKVTGEDCHTKALAHFQEYVKGDPADISVLCPLAGDDPFVYLLFTKGYSVTTIDLVPAAVEEMKKQFQSGNGSESGPSLAQEWTREEKENTVIWKHGSGRATLMVGDALQKRPGLVNQFDAVYDKDSFGALPMQLRNAFCSRIAEYVKQGGIIYLECKLKDDHEKVISIGPPFSLKEEDLMEKTSYGDAFDYVQGLGEIYNIQMAGQQTGHILKRK